MHPLYSLSGLACAAAAAAATTATVDERRAQPGPERRRGDDLFVTEADVVSNTSTVIGIPKTVHAGQEMIWNLTVANSRESGYNHTKMEIYLRAISNEARGYSLYCNIIDCIWTNVTSFAVTVPEDVFPSDVKMRTSYSLFHSPDVGFSSWGTGTTFFTLEDGTAVWSEWEENDGFSAASHWSTRLSCHQVPCVRSCIEEYLDASQPYYSQTHKSDFKACVEQCGPRDMGDYKNRECVTENTTEVSSAQDGGRHVGSGGGSDGGSDGAEDSGGTGKPEGYLGLAFTACLFGCAIALL